MYVKPGGSVSRQRAAMPTRAPRMTGASAAELALVATARARYESRPMRKLAFFAVLVLAACKTTDPLADDVPRAGVDDQGSVGRCIEDPTRDDAPTLSERTLDDSFGIGAGVIVKCLDRAAFVFDNTGHPSRVTLKATVANLSANEVTVFLNGRDVGTLAGDGERTVDLPVDALRPGGNSLLIDNVKNPPGDESWSVSMLSLEFD